MRPVERFAMVKRLAEFLASIESLGEVLMILEMVGSTKTPTSWTLAKGDRSNYSTAFGILSEQSESVLESLQEMQSAFEGPTTSSTTAVTTSDGPPGDKVMTSTPDGPIFVVHGHAYDTLYQAVRVLERGTGLEVVVLHEQANAGRTILEKFEDYAGQVSFAVVLLTGDDEGGVRASDSRSLRGRQNVIFELGFFFGKLGRNRVAVLLQSDVEKPSDIDGLVYISIDGAGAWKYALAKELEAAGISVDRSRIP